MLVFKKPYFVNSGKGAVIFGYLFLSTFAKDLKQASPVLPVGKIYPSTTFPFSSYKNEHSVFSKTPLILIPDFLHFP